MIAFHRTTRLYKKPPVTKAHLSAIPHHPISAVAGLKNTSNALPYACGKFIRSSFHYPQHRSAKVTYPSVPQSPCSSFIPQQAVIPNAIPNTYYCLYCSIHLPYYCSTSGTPPLLFPLLPKCFLVLRVIYPKLRTNEVKERTVFSKKKRKKKPKVRFGFSKRQVQALRVWKKISTLRVVFFSTNLLFGNPSRMKRLSFFFFSFGKNVLWC